MEKYRLWLEKAVKDPDLTAELKQIAGDADGINDRFYRDLEFGTGGLRGVIGAGTNRMNYYTVARATQGLSDYIKEHGSANLSAAVAYDSRNKSLYFAQTAAEVFAGNGIKCHIYRELAPTPMLSYAIRKLGCSSGVVITASHNPAKYNGYKAYGGDGCQMTLEAAEAVLDRIGKTDIFDGIKTLDFEEALKSGMVSYIGDDVIDGFFADVRKQAVHPGICENAGLKVVYTPLNGAGSKPVRRILKDIGVSDVVIVPEQENPDGNFPTCPYPNPEFREALETGLRLCEKVKPDLLIATDPDCDRMGIAVPDKDGYALFSGNEVGAMLLEYICRERTASGTMPKNPVAVKTIVSTGITDKIAEKYGVKLIDVLTGFKFIGEQIGELEKKGETDRFIFGFEESYGYLPGGYVRDKDAVAASMLICEMAAFCRSKNMTLIDARAAMYKEYGYYYHATDNIAFEGETGMSKMKEIMGKIRASGLKAIAGLNVVGFFDYAKGVGNLPKSDVVKFSLDGGASVIVRPSGTEPKLKVYYTAVKEDLEAAKKLQEKLAADFKREII